MEENFSFRFSFNIGDGRKFRVGYGGDPESIRALGNGECHELPEATAVGIASLNL
jgi:hypothetical protein